MTDLITLFSDVWPLACVIVALWAINLSLEKYKAYLETRLSAAEERRDNMKTIHDHVETLRQRESGLVDASIVALCYIQGKKHPETGALWNYEDTQMLLIEALHACLPEDRRALALERLQKS